MDEVIVSNQPDILITEVGSFIGHFLKINDNNYFVAPRMPYTKIFRVKNNVAMFLKDVKVTKDVMDKTATQESFVKYLQEEIAPKIMSFSDGK